MWGAPPLSRFEGESERFEQRLVIKYMRQYSDMVNGSYPVSHGRRHGGPAIAMADGYMKGWPDIQVVEPRGGYYGLFIELKKTHNPSTVSDEQHEFIHKARLRGFYARVCRGYHQARLLFSLYMHEIPPVDQDLDLRPLVRTALDPSRPVEEVMRLASP